MFVDARSFPPGEIVETDILCEGHYGIFREKPDITRFIRSFMR